MFRRLYSSRARDVLSKGFQKMEKDPKYQKNPEDLEKLVGAGKELGMPADVVRQVYRSVKPGEVKPAAGRPAVERATHQANIDSLTTPSPKDFYRPFQHDDLPSAGHLQLEEHRDQRYYVRTAAYELPLLTQYRSEYKRPDPRENPLHFKQFTVLNEETHPVSRKVVLSFKVSDIPDLTSSQLHKLKLVAGNRYDIATDTVKIACSRFPEQAQNKRYLGNLYQRLVATAKDDSDAFADVPLDPRPSLRKAAKKFRLYPSEHKFPAEWNRPDMAPKPKEDLISVLGSRRMTSERSVALKNSELPNIEG